MPPKDKMILKWLINGYKRRAANNRGRWGHKATKPRARKRKTVKCLCAISPKLCVISHRHQRVWVPFHSKFSRFRLDSAPTQFDSTGSTKPVSILCSLQLSIYLQPCTYLLDKSPYLCANSKPSRKLVFAGCLRSQLDRGIAITSACDDKHKYDKIFKACMITKNMQELPYKSEIVESILAVYDRFHNETNDHTVALQMTDMYYRVLFSLEEANQKKAGGA